MLELNSCISLSDKDYRLEKLLGKGKGGYSYLASCGGKFFVLKQIHHEPCSYYQFGNKIMAELNDYERLKNAGRCSAHCKREIRCNAGAGSEVPRRILTGHAACSEKVRCRTKRIRLIGR